jgi:hypothetical protein
MLLPIAENSTRARYWLQAIGYQLRLTTVESNSKDSFYLRFIYIGVSYLQDPAYVFGSTIETPQDIKKSDSWLSRKNWPAQ